MLQLKRDRNVEFDHQLHHLHLHLLLHMQVHLQLGEALPGT